MLLLMVPPGLLTILLLALFFIIEFAAADLCWASPEPMIGGMSPFTTLAKDKDVEVGGLIVCRLCPFVSVLLDADTFELLVSADSSCGIRGDSPILMRPWSSSPSSLNSAFCSSPGNVDGGGCKGSDSWEVNWSLLAVILLCDWSLRGKLGCDWLDVRLCCEWLFLMPEDCDWSGGFSSTDRLLIWFSWSDVLWMNGVVLGGLLDWGGKFIAVILRLPAVTGLCLMVLVELLEDVDGALVGDSLWDGLKVKKTLLHVINYLLTNKLSCPLKCWCNWKGHPAYYFLDATV